MFKAVEKLFLISCVLCVSLEIVKTQDSSQASTTTADPEDDAGEYSPWKTINGKTYYFGIFDEVNRYEAERRCRANDASLAEITSLDDFNAISSYLDSYDLKDSEFWLSGTDMAKQGEFYWENSGILVNNAFTNWEKRQPKNDNTKHCLVTNVRFRWEVEDCSLNHFYICIEN